MNDSQPNPSLDEMPKIYDPSSVEQQAQTIWQGQGSFNADPDGAAGDPFVIVIPPPNVTAALHLGHALNNTLQDILIRWRRMQGRNTLWMPGTDHAGIATQTVVEKRILAEEGKRRTDFSREEFVGRVQAWKDEYEARIIHQLQEMGCSCDWRRTRFTMDETCARAVRATFYKLFADGLIYRGKRLVNWDPATQTVLADDEVEHETVQGHFWYLRYPLETPVEIDGATVDHVTVATTRPETMLGDTAVAMNPRDPRAAALVGKNVRLPLVGRLIPIVADEHVVLADPESSDEKARFSTGCLKVTPAHDTNDWEIGLRHDLDVINVMAPDGTISDRYGWEDAVGSDAEQFLGMDRFEAREAIVEWFRQEDLLADVREYAHEVGHSYRSHVPIEPYLSDQWYIATKKPIDHLAEKFGSETIDNTDVPVNSLAGLGLKPLVDGRLRIVPERYTKNYQMWLENLRDWPISRQLWWGHQIPIWKGSADALGVDVPVTTDEMAPQVQTVEREGAALKVMARTEEDGQTYHYVCVPHDCEAVEEKLEQMGFVRDQDVLDTWFSSALWPFSTLGWPQETPELQTFYPGSVLCTAREIITLWVSRMVMMGQYCLGDIPFSDVFIHAMIQDGQGRKMSKSLGNGIDPLVVIDSHGADAMRFALTSMTTQTQDVRMPVEPLTLPDGRTVNTSPKFDIGRNFCNKLWNASRFALTNLSDVPQGDFAAGDLPLEDRWILSRLAQVVAETTEQLEEFKYSEPINGLYRFFWNEICDWYLELIKPRMKDAALRPTAQRVLAAVLDAALRLLHPFLPFITEGIYQQLHRLCPQRSLQGLLELSAGGELVGASWPADMQRAVDAAAEKDMDLMQNIIRLVREIRTRYQIPPRQEVDVVIKAPAEVCAVIQTHEHLACDMAKIGDLQVGPEQDKPAHAAVAVFEDAEIYVAGVVDVEAERKKLLDQKEKLEKGIRGCEGKLNNEKFVSRAAPEVVQRERDRLAQMQEQLASVQSNLDDLPEA